MVDRYGLLELIVYALNVATINTHSQTKQIATIALSLLSHVLDAYSQNEALRCDLLGQDSQFAKQQKE